MFFGVGVDKIGAFGLTNVERVDEHVLYVFWQSTVQTVRLKSFCLGVVEQFSPTCLAKLNASSVLCLMLCFSMLWKGLIQQGQCFAVCFAMFCRLFTRTFHHDLSKVSFLLLSVYCFLSILLVK